MLLTTESSLQTQVLKFQINVEEDANYMSYFYFDVLL